MVAAHEQPVTNRYTLAYPDHEPRQDDPHYRDFEAYRRRAKYDPALYVCQFAKDRGGDSSECDLSKPLELHHSHVEFALQNAVDLTLLERHYPGISNPDELGTWVESADNLVFYCPKHHRGHGGVHHAAAADWEAAHFVRNLIT